MSHECQINDPLVPAKLCFFEETAKKHNNFFVTFQTSSPMAPFTVDSLGNLVHSFVERFILPYILKKANTMYKLSQLDMTDPNIPMRTYGSRFFH